MTAASLLSWSPSSSSSSVLVAGDEAAPLQVEEESGLDTLLTCTPEGLSACAESPECQWMLSCVMAICAEEVHGRYECLLEPSGDLSSFNLSDSFDLSDSESADEIETLEWTSNWEGILSDNSTCPYNTTASGGFRRLESNLDLEITGSNLPGSLRALEKKNTCWRFVCILGILYYIEFYPC